jgi:hypothetical protein
MKFRIGRRAIVVIRRLLWSLFLPMVAVNSLLFYMVGGWANRNLAALFAVLAIIAIIYEIRRPGCGTVVLQVQDHDAVIPRGTRLTTNTDIVFITLRQGKIGRWTRLRCWLRKTPLPTEIEVPVKCEHHD